MDKHAIEESAVFKKITKQVDDMDIIDGYFQSATYRGDTVRLPISDLAEFIRFFQPNTDKCEK